MTTAAATDWKAEESRWLLPGYAQFPFVLERGEGAWVWDSEGRRYLDFYAGHAVALLGHCPPAVVAALRRQAGELLFYSTLATLPVRARAARALVELCGAEGSRVFFSNSGAEANENAMRVARRATGRRLIVAVEGSFHGRTAGALAATGIPHYRQGVQGLGTDVTFVPFGDLAAAEAALGPEAAGFLLEPVQGLAGAVHPPSGYLEGLARLCRGSGALLIFDEVQTGLGRLGAPSAAQAFGVQPDLQTFAKGLGSGVPCAATLAGPRAAAAVRPGDLGSTFGGGPLAAAAVEATLGELSRARLWENAARLELRIRETFRMPGVLSVQGKGLLLGLVLDRPAKAVQSALVGRGVLTGTAEDPRVLRLLPPLIIGDAEVELLRAALSDTLGGTPS
ncbi:MAG: aminotransferase class III-fold pyridoxal phosphate-dependent enzyme [Elusimicrobiota bacterium]|jgi:acetylornithine aminotransferase/acetylornithine/N-succinyldiaminopimelate aminotransferase